MKFKKFIPHPALQSYVKCFWLLNIEEGDITFSQRLFPFGSFELIFNFDNVPQMQIDGNNKTFYQPASMYTGQFTKSFLLNYTKPFHAVGISFQPWAGNLLFNIPAQNFTNCITKFDDIDSESNLREQLIDAKNETDMLLFIEKYLFDKLKHYQMDDIVTDIAKAIISNPSVHTYKNIVSSIGISSRRIEQRFLKSTGLQMGLFVRKIRFQKTIRILQQKGEQTLSHIGLDAGYYDQSHFIREFKELSSYTPKEFLKQNSILNENVSNFLV